MLSARIAVPTALVAAAFAAFCTPRTFAAYAFTNIIDSTIESTISGQEGVAIDGATVAIHAGDEVFTMTSGVRTKIAEEGDPGPTGTLELFDPFQSVDLSGGSVSFFARSNNDVSGIFRGSGGPLTTIAKTGDMTPEGEINVILPVSRTGISGGAVAFTARTTPGLTAGVYVGSGGSLTTVVKEGDPAPTGIFGFAGLDPGAAISGSRVAFMARYGPVAPTQQGVFTSEGGTLTTVAKSGDPAAGGSITSLSFPKINGDVVAFLARVDNIGGTGDGIFTGNGGPLTTIVKVGDPAPTGEFTTAELAGIASDGQQVAFKGSWSGGGRGVFVSDGGVIATVVKGGDHLFGHPVTGLSSGYAAALDRSGSGNVVFGYRLANGVAGIALATPVPEPAGALLAACAGAVFAMGRALADSMNAARRLRGAAELAAAPGDSILTAEEIAFLPLGGAQLVVLSACETGLGEVAGGEGLLGVQRAFQVAGARTTIATLWKVSDEATRRIMEEFYRNYLEREMPALEALRAAQLWALNNPELVPRAAELVGEESQEGARLSPYYWAAFTLSGDWR